MIASGFAYNLIISPITILLFLAVASNLMVTALISWYLRRARRNLSKVLPPNELELYTGWVAVWIESAAPLTLLGIIYAPIFARSPTMYRSALWTFKTLFDSFCVRHLSTITC